MTDINWEKITIEKSRFILDQSEKCLNASLSNTDLLDKKGFIILAGLLSFISALLAIMVTKDISFTKSLILFLIVIGFLLSSCFCMQALTTKKVKLIGNKPKTMLAEEFSGYNENHLIQCEALSNESKISTAIEVNHDKGLLINKSLKTVQITLFIAVSLLPIITL